MSEEPFWHEIDRDTSVAKVPGGLLYRYENYNSGVALAFVPCAHAEDFIKTVGPR
jgi:hypothetical protein